MRIAILVILVSSLSVSAVFAQDNEFDRTQGFERTNLELPNIQVIPIKDSQNDRAYDLYVKLPESYSDGNETRYPVLYTTDALWHIEILSAATEYIMEDVILVGISWQKDIDKALLEEHGAHVSRYRDYSVTPSGNPEIQAKYQLGQAGSHLDFIRNDVFKFVEGNFRTHPENRTYFGYSLGGVFGAYTLLKQPDTFKNYILGSPSLKGDIPHLSELESNCQNLSVNVFISCGTMEDELGGYVDEFIGLLKARNNKSLSLTHERIEGNHQTAFPLTGVRSVTWLSDLVKK